MAGPLARVPPDDTDRERRRTIAGTNVRSWPGRCIRACDRPAKSERIRRKGAARPGRAGGRRRAPCSSSSDPPDAGSAFGPITAGVGRPLKASGVCHRLKRSGAPSRAEVLQHPARTPDSAVVGSRLGIDRSRQTGIVSQEGQTEKRSMSLIYRMRCRP
jgi:hypothetical protein